MSAAAGLIGCENQKVFMTFGGKSIQVFFQILAYCILLENYTFSGNTVVKCPYVQNVRQNYPLMQQKKLKCSSKERSRVLKKNVQS